MSDILKAFEKGKVFISFLTAGDPCMDKTEEFILALAQAGTDLFEIGVPFSDPIAEGVVIEKANMRALAAGATTDGLFDMVARARQKTNVPIVLLTYMNPVFVYGTERFFKRCGECGVDGVIIPDLPFEEKDEVTDVTKKYGVEFITLIAPTSKDRVRMLAQNAEGFIYAVSSMGVTGVREEIITDVHTLFEEIRKASDAPVAVGFGIATPEQAYDISRYADGVIVGSAIVRIIEEYGEDAAPRLIEYVKSMKEAVSRP